MVTIELGKIEQGKGEVFVSFCEVRSITKIVVTYFLMIWRVFA